MTNRVERNRGKAGAFFRGFGMLLGSVLFGALVYLCCVLLGNGEEMRAAGTETKPQAITRLQAGDFTDLSLLKHSFGAPVPYWAQTPFEGESRNREHAGENVRCMEMRFENGCRVQAVMPETAASLIWEKKGSSLTGGSVRDVQGAPVMTAALEDGTAFGFALEGTYYAVFVPDMDEQRADEILSNMIWLY